MHNNYNWKYRKIQYDDRISFMAIKRMRRFWVIKDSVFAIFFLGMFILMYTLGFPFWVSLTLNLILFVVIYYARVARYKGWLFEKNECGCYLHSLVSLDYFELANFQEQVLLVPENLTTSRYIENTSGVSFSLNAGPNCVVVLPNDIETAINIDKYLVWEDDSIDKCQQFICELKQWYYSGKE